MAKQRPKSLNLINPNDQGELHQISKPQDESHGCDASSKTNTNKTTQGFM